MSWLLVALGGALGSLARHGANRLWPATPGGWPVPTLTVNLIGSFAIGLLYMYVAARGAAAEQTRLFWMTGVLGGFTTYSTFNYETLQSFREGAWALGMLNVTLTLAGCLAAGVAGVTATRLLFGR